MKKIVYFVASLMMLSACSDSFLKEEPVGEFMPDQVNDPANVEGIIIHIAADRSRHQWKTAEVHCRT